MKKIALFSFAVSALLMTSCGKNSPLKGGKPKSMEDTVAYAIGNQIGANIKNGGGEKLNVNMIAKGIQDALGGKDALVKPEAAQAVIQKYFMDMRLKKVEENKKQGEKFLEENKKKAGVKTTVSGLQYIVEKEGTGEKPSATNVVKVHYHGTKTDGTVFDSSKDRGEPATFPLNQVIPGWTEGVQLMSVGSKYKFFVPANLAYGEMGAPNGAIGPNEVLIFEVELLSIEKGQAQEGQQGQ